MKWTYYTLLVVWLILSMTPAYAVQLGEGQLCTENMYITKNNPLKTYIGDESLTPTPPKDKGVSGYWDGAQEASKLDNNVKEATEYTSIKRLDKPSVSESNYWNKDKDTQSFNKVYCGVESGTGQVMHNLGFYLLTLYVSALFTVNPCLKALDSKVEVITSSRDSISTVAAEEFLPNIPTETNIIPRMDLGACFAQNNIICGVVGGLESLMVSGQTIIGNVMVIGNGIESSLFDPGFKPNFDMNPITSGKDPEPDADPESYIPGLAPKSDIKPVNRLVDEVPNSDKFKVKDDLPKSSNFNPKPLILPKIEDRSKELGRINPENAMRRSDDDARLLGDMNPEDAAERLGDMSFEDAARLLSAMNPEDAVKILEEMDPEDTARILTYMDPGTVLNIFLVMRPVYAGVIMLLLVPEAKRESLSAYWTLEDAIATFKLLGENSDNWKCSVITENQMDPEQVNQEKQGDNKPPVNQLMQDPKKSAPKPDSKTTSTGTTPTPATRETHQNLPDMSDEPLDEIVDMVINKEDYPTFAATLNNKNYDIKKAIHILDQIGKKDSEFLRFIWSLIDPARQFQIASSLRGMRGMNELRQVVFPRGSGADHAPLPRVDEETKSNRNIIGPVSQSAEEPTKSPQLDPNPALTSNVEPPTLATDPGTMSTRDIAKAIIMGNHALLRSTLYNDAFDVTKACAILLFIHQNAGKDMFKTIVNNMNRDRLARLLDDISEDPETLAAVLNNIERVDVVTDVFSNLNPSQRSNLILIMLQKGQIGRAIFLAERLIKADMDQGIQLLNDLTGRPYAHDQVQELVNQILKDKPLLNDAVWDAIILISKASLTHPTAVKLLIDAITSTITTPDPTMQQANKMSMDQTMSMDQNWVDALNQIYQGILGGYTDQNVQALIKKIKTQCIMFNKMVVIKLLDLMKINKEFVRVIEAARKVKNDRSLKIEPKIDVKSDDTPSDTARAIVFRFDQTLVTKIFNPTYLDSIDRVQEGTYIWRHIRDYYTPYFPIFFHQLPTGAIIKLSQYFRGLSFSGDPLEADVITILLNMDAKKAKKSYYELTQECGHDKGGQSVLYMVQRGYMKHAEAIITYLLDKDNKKVRLIIHTLGKAHDNLLDKFIQNMDIKNIKALKNIGEWKTGIQEMLEKWEELGNSRELTFEPRPPEFQSARMAFRFSESLSLISRPPRSSMGESHALLPQGRGSGSSMGYPLALPPLNFGSDHNYEDEKSNKGNQWGKLEEEEKTP